MDEQQHITYKGLRDLPHLRRSLRGSIGPLVFPCSLPQSKMTAPKNYKHEEMHTVGCKLMPET